MKASTYYFHMKADILPDFQICIIVPLSTYIIDFDEGFSEETGETIMNLNF